MGQDGEAAAELVATIRGEHVVMKNWFMGTSAEAKALRDKYGPYPSLWKEVLNWPGWKESRKAYLQFTQTKSGTQSGQAPRKRRSRWGNAADDNNSGGNNNNNEEHANKRRSRWGRDAPPNAPPPPQAPPALPGLVLPGMPTNLSAQQQSEMSKLQARLRTINDKLANLESEAERVDNLPRGHPERSPSPPPEYGADGKRKNTRAERWRERYTAERHDVLEKLMNLNPATRRSGLYKRKRTKKIRIPVEEHPTYNFIGLIIGPRGKTQKELEAKTGCKIAIRGRGSVKEGARGRRDGKIMEGDDEPLHVVISGDDQKSVDAATDMIEQMLVVIDDEKNIHKQQQLRELALLNGTLKEDEYCQICAEKGHRSFECPRRFAMKKPSVAVKCAICGDTSHPTRDCTQRPAEQKNTQELDSEYMSFMAELDGKKVEKKDMNAMGKGPGIPGGAGAGALGNEQMPAASLPPPPTGMPPPPSGAGASQPPMAGSAPPPPPQIPPSVGLPQPSQVSAASLPPPPVSNPGNGGQGQQGGNYYGAQQNNYSSQGGQYQQQYQQQQYGQNQNYQQHYGQQHHQQHQNHQQQNHQQQQGQQGQYQYAQNGNPAGGWDYRSYYGYGGTGGDAGGAGGFNWWG